MATLDKEWYLACVFGMVTTCLPTGFSRLADSVFDEDTNSDIRFVHAVAKVESGFDQFAEGNAGELGILQIRPVMVDEVNRILGHERYDLDDRTSIPQSVTMFVVYTRHWNAHTGDFSYEGMARRWNGGPRGHEKGSTEAYWEKVKDEFIGRSKTESLSASPVFGARRFDAAGQETEDDRGVGDTTDPFDAGDRADDRASTGRVLKAPSSCIRVR